MDVIETDQERTDRWASRLLRIGHTARAGLWWMWQLWGVVFVLMCVGCVIMLIVMVAMILLGYPLQRS